MEYKIYFTLGDPSNDGHGMTEDWYITANHSVREIDNAYRNVTEKLGYDFLADVCSEYEDSKIYLETIDELEVKFNIDIKSSFNSYQLKDLEEGYCYIDTDDFISIFFELIKTELPDFKWDKLHFKGELLAILDGAGYGFFGH